jgi:hypothetical protein
VDREDWAQRHKQFKAALDTDQVEREAIRTGLTSIEFGIEDERTAGIVDDALEQEGNSWVERQEILETLGGATLDEVSRRIEIMGAAYPFKVVDGALEYIPSQTGVYEFCLAVAANPTSELTGYKGSAVFEYIAKDVLTLHIGGGEGFRTGAPIYAVEGRGTTAKETFDALHLACGEFCWNPMPGLPEEPSHKDLKDAGLDVVVWKPWQDRRLAHLFLIGQCSCGKNDVSAEKARELSLKRLDSWLRPICYAWPPMRAFLTAHHIPNTRELYDISGEGGLVFDRARIAILAESDVKFMKRKNALDYKALADLVR